MKKPLGIDFTDPDTLHDIDYFANGPMHYDFKGQIPVVDGNTLNQMFPKGFEIDQESTNVWMIIYQIWKMCEESISESWDYKGLPEELDKYIIETKIMENGSAAFFKLGAKFYVTGYTTSKTDIYNRPTEISVEAEGYKMHKIKIKDFVIIKHTNSAQPLFNLIIRYLESMTNILRQINKNIYASAPKGVFLTQIGRDNNGKITQAMNDIAKSDQTFYTLNVDNNTMQDFQQRVSNDKNGQIFEPIELRDRTAELHENYNFMKSIVNEICGIDVDFMMNKRERKNVTEVETQNDSSDKRLKHMFNMRKMAIEEINKKFGLKITIELDEPEEEVIENDQPIQD